MVDVNTKTYFVPEREHSIEVEVKKSRFIACGQCVVDRPEAMAFLQAVKEAYPNARHYCWAYLVGDPASASNAGMNDDGEPSGTAGKPILNVIQHKKIGNVMVVVVRYFGGIKLGAGGLTRAYSSSVEALLSSMALAEYVQMQIVELSFDFPQESLLRRCLFSHNAKLISINYTSQVDVRVELPSSLAQAFIEFCHGVAIKVKPE